MEPAEIKNRILSYYHRANSRRFQLLTIVLPVSTLVMSLVLSLILWNMFDNSLKARSQAIYADRTDDISSVIIRRLHDHEQVLRGAAGLFSVREDVSRTDWRHYVSSLRLDANHPGILGIGFSKWLTPEENVANTLKIRSEGLPEYNIRPEGKRPSYTSIIYLEPFNWRNQRAFGYDMYTESVRRAAMDRARDENVATIAAKIILVQETDKDKQSGMLLFVPVYRQGKPLDTLENRRKAFIGFAYSPIRMNDFVYGSLSKLPQDIAFDITIAGGQSSDNLMFSSVQAEKITLPENYKPRITTSTLFQAYGCSWQFTFKSLPGFNKELNQGKSYAVLFSGIIFSILVSCMVLLLLITRQQAIELAEEKLHNSEARFNILLSASPTGAFEADSGGGFTYVNDKWCSITDTDATAAMGDGWFDALHPDDRQHVITEWKNTITEKWVFEMEFRFMRPDGNIRWVYALSATLQGIDGEVKGYVGTVNDITDRRRIEDVLRESEEHFRKKNLELLKNREQLSLALAGADLGLWDWNLVSSRVNFSREWAAMLEYKVDDLEPSVSAWEALVHPDDMPFVQNALQRHIAGETSLYETEHRCLTKSGEWRWILARGRVVEWASDGSPVRAAGTHLDVTVRKQAEDKLLQLNEELEQRIADEVHKNREKDSLLLHQDKMSSIGLLAAGVAHEINNPIAFISSNLGTLKGYVESLRQFCSLLQGIIINNSSYEEQRSLKEVTEQLDIVYILEDIDSLIAESAEGAERVKRIVHDLKDFARVEESSFEQVDLNDCVQSAINIVRNEIKYVADLDLQLGEIPQVSCSRQQINQVIINLLVNAAQSINTHGSIVVSTWQENDQVLLNVSDTGHGMSEEVKKKIFDPFFTTKEVGKGTGLGLSISFSIIKKHGGEITLASIEGKGTTFTVRLPISPGPVLENTINTFMPA